MWIAAGGVACGTVIALALAAAFALQYRANDRPLALPRPRGPHPIGRALLDWKDDARNRELMLFLWYPARDGAAGRRCEYIPGKWGELESENLPPIPARRLRELSTNAIEDAPPAAGTLPVLVLLPGMGRIPAHYSVLAEDLASYGYVVLGVTPTGYSRHVVFADGRVAEGRDDPNVEDRATARAVLRIWAGDASFALSRLLADGRFPALDARRIGVFGHSFGGDVAAHLPGLDSRFARAANLDGAPFGDPIRKLDRPLLVMDSGGAADPGWKTVCSANPAFCAAMAMPQAGHMNFSDAGILPSRFPFPKSLLMLGNVEGEPFLRQVADRLREFFAATGGTQSRPS